MALVRVPFYFRNFLPTSLLYIYILLTRMASGCWDRQSHTLRDKEMIARAMASGCWDRQTHTHIHT